MYLQIVLLPPSGKIKYIRLTWDNTAYIMTRSLLTTKDKYPE